MVPPLHSQCIPVDTTSPTDPSHVPDSNRNSWTVEQLCHSSVACCRHPCDSRVRHVWVLLTAAVSFREEYWRWPDGSFMRADGTDWDPLAWERDTDCGDMIEANKIMECGTVAINQCLCPTLRLKSPLSLLRNISAVSAIYTFFPLRWQQLSFSK